LDIDRKPKVDDAGAAVAEFDACGDSVEFITHLPFVAGCVEQADDDPAEGRQRSLLLFVGQQIPLRVACRRFGIGSARGGTRASVPDMDLLLDRTKSDDVAATRRA
jgi:hypothetical protein